MQRIHWIIKAEVEVCDFSFEAMIKLEVLFTESVGFKNSADIGKSDDGPLQAVEQDVLAALLTLGYYQAQFASNPIHNQFASSDEFGTSNCSRIYYTLSEICRRLKLDVGSVSPRPLRLSKFSSY